MLNDVISLCVGLWAVRVATKRASTQEYTYGWARAELLGGLVNGVFLIALCVSIVLDAIQRFFEPQEVSNPKLVLIVGAVGLAFNILGLFVFGHGHDHGDEGHEHEHAHDQVDAAENGHAHKSHDHGPSITFQEGTHAPASPARPHDHNRRSRGNSRSYSTIDDMPIHPSSVRAGILAKARGEESDSETDDTGDEEAVVVTESTSLLGNTKSSARADTSNHSHNHSHSHTRGSDVVDHSKHAHARPRKSTSGGGHGHNHADMNMRGMFLHVLGDALGNVGVMASALIIWQTTWPYRYYADPAISLVITLIILKSAIPLCRDTAKPLLQAVPEHVSVDDITKDIASIPGVRSCHHVHVWALTPQRLVATLDVEVGFGFGPGTDAQKLGGRERWMALAREIKRCLHAYGIHSSTIQPEFCVDHSAEEHHAANSAGSVGGDAAVALRAPGDDAGCGNGTCLLDCKDGCRSGKECCGPAAIGPDGNGQGGQSHEHEHEHGHGHEHEH
ncbi:hypothetical protein FH972_026382 [Carpinus fangiana]|uniref:Cation efflux protein cytoplasmic domain-containing protein n=1 Tax=Carpinus fangiana TaxID=176857 RepID=A0A5N6L3U3_9ROSI|nr:hypothetical protein FH972_026382 [Carpinus fangiana]